MTTGDRSASVSQTRADQLHQPAEQQYASAMPLAFVHKLLWAVTLTVIAGVLVAGCSSSVDELSPFGSEDTVCDSVEVEGVQSQSDVQRAVACLMAEMEAGRAVTVDVKFPAPGGAVVYSRLAFDGETVWMIQDDRLDAFGPGTVKSETCARIVPTDWLPAGDDCDPVPTLGFPEVTAGLE